MKKRNHSYLRRGKKNQSNLWSFHYTIYFVVAQRLLCNNNAYKLMAYLFTLSNQIFHGTHCEKQSNKNMNYFKPNNRTFFFCCCLVLLLPWLVLLKRKGNLHINSGNVKNVFSFFFVILICVGYLHVVFFLLFSERCRAMKLNVVRQHGPKEL